MMEFLTVIIAIFITFWIYSYRESLSQVISAIEKHGWNLFLIFIAVMFVLNFIGFQIQNALFPQRLNEVERVQPYDGKKGFEYDISPNN